MPLLSKTICRQKEKKSPRDAANGWIESSLQGLYKISTALLWNIQFQNDDNVKTWLISSLHLHVCASVENVQNKKGQVLRKCKSVPKESSKKEKVSATLTSRMKLGEAEVILGRLISRLQISSLALYRLQGAL